jgi:Flp pilus assembly pilin Flp
MFKFRSLAGYGWRQDDGQALVEYTLILGFVALVAVTVLTTLGTNVTGPLTTVANAL